VDARAVIRDVELAYEQSDGCGLPLVWGHGLTSSRADERTTPLLDLDRIGAARRVLRYDARGHGESGLTAELAAYRWDAMAADQLALADALGIDRYVAGGASMGAATALYAAIAAPERVAALVLVIPPTAWETRDAQRELYRSMADVVERRGVELLLRGTAQLPPPDPYAGDAQWREARVQRLREADPQRLAAVFRGAATTDLPPRDRVATIRAPTLVLAWTGDTGHPVSTAVELARLIPGARLLLASTRDELARWTNEVEAFLEGS
jgi:pimeloyl-ACP methyl ester carboxylesterase